MCNLSQLRGDVRKRSVSTMTTNISSTKGNTEDSSVTATKSPESRQEIKMPLVDALRSYFQKESRGEANELAEAC